ncbi:MAG TPA: glycoside hydrolase family 38 C-terminal domain-containing protein [Armatimonadota bacterium]|jgi:alpha-mannosidase
MTTLAAFNDSLAALNSSEEAWDSPLKRLRYELKFLSSILPAHPEQATEGQALLEQVLGEALAGLRAGTAPAAVVEEAERRLAPLGPLAKAYVLFCAGHAHIDMNWMWTWPETVSVTYDTFQTMDRLMDEFPEFCFSQSQASVYQAMQQYAPEVLAMIKRRVQEGRWEITASQWVEGDKNMASGEILCRHLLYTRRWLQENLGLPYDAVKIDWECDTFGHCWTLPGILSRGGVTRYYHHRSNGPRLRSAVSGERSRLFWWESPDGSRVLTFDDSPYGYNNEINPQMVDGLAAWERNTGLKEMLWVYGVGDHGGGPTRKHLRAAVAMQSWPLWPTLKLTTTDDFFNTVEAKLAGRDLPVHADELNFVFEGCYTSQSQVKFANRQGENALVGAEAAAVLGLRLAGVAYPGPALLESWQRAMFLQFHDILPGSGVRETYEHAQGQFQETLAHTNMIKTRSLRTIAAAVNTAAGAPLPPAGGLGLGAGVGDGAWWGGVSALGAGEGAAEPFVVFNLTPFVRDELVVVKLWNRPVGNQVTVRDAAGNIQPGQILERGHYWGHQCTSIAFRATALPACGYATYLVEPCLPEEQAPIAETLNLPPVTGEEATGAYLREMGRPIYGLGYVQAQYTGAVALGNEYLEVVISPEAGGVVSVLDKESGHELVAAEAVLGALEHELEAPHPMSSWQLGAIIDRKNPLAGCTLQSLHQGPAVAAVKLSRKFGDSTYDLTISLAGGSRRLDFDLDVDWREPGGPEIGVPALRATFPLNLEETRAQFEIACGSIERETDGEESPALNWVDLSGSCGCEEGCRFGATLLNEGKYGHQAFEETLRLTLLRSSYEPDPLPDQGRHEIRYALEFHAGDCDLAAAARAGLAFNHPVVPVGTTVHEGALPPAYSGLEVLSPGVLVSGLKRAEDSEALVVRLYEIAGEATEARLRLAPELAPVGAPVVETDVLEQPLAASTARWEGETLVVSVPAYGLATVRVG